MRILTLIAISLALPAWADSKTDLAKVEQTLQRLASDIRARAEQAEAAVRQAQGDANTITAAAEAQAKKIRDDADAYVKKIEREIEEIKKNGARAPASPPGAPTREQLTATLDAMVDPLLTCWKGTTAAGLENCLQSRVEQGLSALIKK